MATIFYKLQRLLSQISDTEENTPFEVTASMILNVLSALYLDSVSIHLHDCAVGFLGSETVQCSQQVLIVDIDTYLDEYLLIIILCHLFLLFFLSFFFLHNLWVWLAFLWLVWTGDYCTAKIITISGSTPATSMPWKVACKTRKVSY